MEPKYLVQFTKDFSVFAIGVVTDVVRIHWAKYDGVVEYVGKQMQEWVDAANKEEYRCCWCERSVFDFLLTRIKKAREAS